MRTLTICLLVAALSALAAPAVAEAPTAAASADDDGSSIECTGPPCDQINFVCLILFQHRCLG